VVDVIISNTLDDRRCSFQYVFKMLARKGVFLDECDNTIVTEATLATVRPFNIVSLTNCNRMCMLTRCPSLLCPSLFSIESGEVNKYSGPFKFQTLIVKVFG